VHKAVHQSQRERILDAVAEHEYARTMVAHVVSRAGVSRKTFYESFDKIEDCFAAAYQLQAKRRDA